MGYYDPALWTYGYELELADVNKGLEIPARFGNWEYSEHDIANTLAPYAGVAVDPMGMDPPVGGEINTVPSRSWPEQVELIMELLDYIREAGEPANASFTSPGHVHIHVPGLTEDIDALKRLTAYVRDNQEDMVRLCYQYRRYSDMPKDAQSYMQFDGGKLLPAHMAENILAKARNLEDFLLFHRTSKEGGVYNRYQRYAINMYCLKHVSTIEVRAFRATLDREEIANSFRAVERFMDAALNGGPRFEELVTDLKFAPMGWNAKLWRIYSQSRKRCTDQDVLNKNRQFYPPDSLPERSV